MRLWVGLLLWAWAGAASADTAALQARVDAAFGAGELDGVVQVTERGQTVFSAASLPDAATPWRLASITKQITAVLVMQEVEAGRLTLSDTLAQHLTAYVGHPAAGVTVKQLLNHTSGLANPSSTPLIDNEMPEFYTRPAADHGYCAGPMRAAPGDGFDYNNCDYFVLADILTAVTGQTYAELIDARLTTPLGLTTLRLYGPDGPKESFVATGAAGEVEPFIAMSSYEAAAGLSASAEDLARFDQALMDGRLLKPESLAVLWAGEPSLGYVALGAWSYTVQPSGCSEPLDLVERRGGIGYVNTLNLLLPKRQASIIVFSSTGATDWGQLWQDKGLMRDLAVAAWCK